MRSLSRSITEGAAVSWRTAAFEGVASRASDARTVEAGDGSANRGDDGRICERNKI